MSCHRTRSRRNGATAGSRGRVGRRLTRQAGISTPASIASRTSSGRLRTSIFSMTRARWISTVRALMPRL